MIIHKAFQFRLYPNQHQITLINKTFGCSRFVYNHFLAKWNEQFSETGKGLTCRACSAQLPALKQSYAWLKEVDAISLQTVVRHLADAFHRFFRRQNEKPRWKSKKNPVQSYTTKWTNGNIKVIGSKLQLPKLGLVSFAKSREVEGRILNATITRKPSGKYVVSILTEVDVSPWPKSETPSVVGIDLGIKDFAVLSNGDVLPNPRFFRNLEQQLAKAQRKMSRRTKGGSNWNKARIKVARIHEQIHHARTDYLHKCSTEIIKNHDLIGLEQLRVSNMLQNHKLAKAISEVSWSTFCRMLTYKAKWVGKQVIRVSSTFPSSQRCSSCHVLNNEIKDLSIRQWDCPACGAHHDRDINASLNLRHEAMRLLTEGTSGIA